MRTYIPELSEPARRWLRFGALVAGIGLLCWIAYALRGVFTPVLIGAAIAYIVNPVVTWFEKAQRVPRLAIVIIAFAVLATLVVSCGLYAAGLTIAQLEHFRSDSGRYRAQIGAWINAAGARDLLGAPPAASAPATNESAASQPVSAGRQWWQAVEPLLEEHGADVAGSIVAHVSAALRNVANLVSLLVLVPMFAFFFMWRFNDMVRVIHDHLPAAYRPAIVHAVSTIDSAVANFFRGRLLVCLAVGSLMGIGWTIFGVPYSLPLGILAGTLNLVPFMSLLALPPALLFAYLQAADVGAPWLWPVVLAMGVYMVVQALESFVLSPAIEGRSSGLHPLVIVVALMIGAQVAGLLGMLLAIPVASTLRTFSGDLVLPELRRLAGSPSADAASGRPEAVDSGNTDFDDD